LEYCPGGSLEDLIVQHQNDQKYFKGQESMKIQKSIKNQEYTESIYFENCNRHEMIYIETGHPCLISAMT